MLKLIRLEWKKNRIGKDVRNAVILALCLGFFVYSVEFFGITDEIPEANSIGISAFIELLTNMSFIVFCGAMLASYIVGAYKNKTMNLMFSYPIKRQKILLSKMLAVWIFNYAALILTKLAVYGVILIGSRRKEFVYTIDFRMETPGFYIGLAISSAVMVSICFAALFVGLMMKSSKAVIIASVLLMFVTQGSIGDLTLSNSGGLFAVLLLISFVCVVLSLCTVEKRDML